MKPILLLRRTENRISKREKPKTAVDTKTENPKILSTKTEKPNAALVKKWNVSGDWLFDHLGGSDLKIYSSLQDMISCIYL